MSTFMLYHLTCMIYISLPISQSDILWHYKMNETIPSEWVKSGSISAITSLQSPTGLGSCPSATDYCWQGYANFKQNDWMLTRNTQSTIDYQNIQFTYQISTQLTVGNCIIEYTTNSGTNWQNIQSITQQNVDINSSIDTWNPSPNNNPDGIQIRIQSVSADHGDRYCWFNEFKLTADKITSQPTTSLPTTFVQTTYIPTTSNPTTSAPTTHVPTTSMPTTANLNPTTINPTESPATHSPTMISQSPSKLPTINPITIITIITLTPSILPTKSPVAVSESAVSFGGTAIIHFIGDLIDLVQQNLMISVIIAAGTLCMCMICCVSICICCRKRRRKKKSKTDANMENIAMTHYGYPVKTDSADTHDSTNINYNYNFKRNVDTVTPLRAPVITAHVKVKKIKSKHLNDNCGLDWADPSNYGRYTYESDHESDHNDHDIDTNHTNHTNEDPEEEIKIEEHKSINIEKNSVSENNMDTNNMNADHDAETMLQQDIESNDSLMRTQQMFLNEIDAPENNSSLYHD